MTSRYIRVPEEVDALQIVTGVTTKDQILEMDPKANVGAVVGNPLDIRWVVLSNGQVMESFGDWIVRSQTGRLRIFTATQFALDYRPETLHDRVERERKVQQEAWYGVVSNLIDAEKVRIAEEIELAENVRMA